MAVFDMFKMFKAKATENRRMAIDILCRSYEAINTSVLSKLMDKYGAGKTRSETALIGAAIMNKITGQPPGHKKAEEFLAANEKMIERAALEVHKDEVLAKAISYLYATITLRFSIETRNPVTEQSVAVVELANRYGFYIPNTFDICGSADAVECVLAIDKYARELAGSIARPA